MKIFLSWSRETKVVAEALSAWLLAKRAGIECWFSSEDINAGQQWRGEIDKALDSADCAILCIGPSAVVSPWVLYESGAIGSRKPIIPIALLIPPTAIPPILSGFQLLNAYPASALSPDPAFPQSLLNGINSVLGTEIPIEPDEHDNRLLVELRDFASSRVQSLAAALRATKRTDALIEILRHVRANKSNTPVAIVDNDPITSLFGKKYLATLALFWLEEKGLLNILDFDDITSGKVELSYDGEMLVTYMESAGN